MFRSHQLFFTDTYQFLMMNLCIIPTDSHKKKSTIKLIHLLIVYNKSITNTRIRHTREFAEQKKKTMKKWKNKPTNLSIF